MKIIFLLLFNFFITACMNTPEAPSSKAIVAQRQIQNNKSEAQKAQKEYIKLQKQRNNE